MFHLEDTFPLIHCDTAIRQLVVTINSTFTFIIKHFISATLFAASQALKISGYDFVARARGNRVLIFFMVTSCHVVSAILLVVPKDFCLVSEAVKA